MPGPAVIASLPVTASLAWAQFEPGGPLEPKPVEPPNSSEATSEIFCSTDGAGQTCSTGNGGSGSSCSSAGWPTDNFYCSADADNGAGGRCSASVDGGGGSGEFCSAQGWGAQCSVQGSSGRASCSATGEGTCSSDAIGGACTAHNSSGSGTACSVTEGSGGSCTEGVSSSGSCSTGGSGGGHCSSWVSGGGPVEDGDDVDVCQG